MISECTYQLFDVIIPLSVCKNDKTNKAKQITKSYFVCLRSAPPVSTHSRRLPLRSLSSALDSFANRGVGTKIDLWLNGITLVDSGGTTCAVLLVQWAVLHKVVF